MPATYEPIATTTLSSAASSITFSSIPGTYTDLRLVFVGIKDASANGDWIVRFNSDGGTNYSFTAIQGDGTSASSYMETSTNHIPLIYFAGTLSTTTPQIGTLDIFSYAGSTNKTVLNTESSDNNGSGRVARAVGLWRNTAAITSITIRNSGNLINFGVGTTATLYGILKA